MCFHLYPKGICCQSAPNCFAVMGADVCSARPCIISHFPSFLVASLLLPSPAKCRSKPLRGGGGGRLLTNGLQTESKESPVRVRQATPEMRERGGRKGGAARVLIWTQRSMFSSDTAERAMTVESQEMIVNHCFSRAGLRPDRQAKWVFSGMARVQSKSHPHSPDLQF